MIKISKQNNSLIVEGIDNVFYPNNGDNSYPLNSLIVVTDNSDMATFRSVATNDVLFSGLINNITINGEVVTKDNIIEKFDTVSNSSTGGGGGGTVDAYTKEEADNKFATKTELTNVQTVANDADTKADAATSRVESVETSLGNKQDTLVSGTNIKTINNQSILGEGNIEITGGDVDLTNYYTKTEADEIFATTTQVNHQAADISALETDMRGKQATLVSGENIKTINSESILGTGDIQINGVSEEQAQEIAKIPTLETNMMAKQDTLVSGTNIKTINGESVLGEGNIEVAKKTDIPSTDNLATKDELTAVETVANNADAKADAATSRIESVETAMGNKQDTLVSGTNIKTVNSQSILGEGNIIIEGSGGIKTYEASEIPSVLLKELKEAVSNALTKRDYSKYTTTDVTPISQFLSNLSNGDYLKLYNDNGYKLQFVGNKIVGTDFYYYFNIIVVGPSQTKIYSNYITVTVLSSQIYVGNNKSVEVAKITDIPNTDNLATKDELTAVETSLNNKQDTLVSGTNIKTINSQSILGEGNIEVTIPDATTATSGAMSAADKTKLDSMSTEWTGTQSEFDALATKEDNIIYYVTE